MYLQHSQHHILQYWSGAPNQSSLSSNAHRSRSSRTSSRQGRTLSVACIRVHLSRPLAPPLPLLATPRRRLLLVQGARQPVVAKQNHPHHNSRANQYIVRFLDDPGPIQLTLSPGRYDADQGAPCGAWCLQVHATAPSCAGFSATLTNEKVRHLPRTLRRLLLIKVPPTVSLA